MRQISLHVLLSMFLWIHVTPSGYTASWDNWDQSTLFNPANDPGTKVQTTPQNGTCGDDILTNTVYYNGEMFTCTPNECPSISQTYPDNQQYTINEILLLSGKAFWADDCSGSSRVNYNYEGPDYNYNSGEDLTDSCFTYNQNVALYERETHTMWIKPNMGHKIKTGTIMNLNIGISIGIYKHYLTLNNRYSQSVYEELYLEDNTWYHIGLQLYNTGRSNLSPFVFINGKLVDLKFDVGPSRKRRKTTRRAAEYISSGYISFGIDDSTVYQNYEGFQTEPLQIGKCIDIGYSSSIGLRCKYNSQENTGSVDCSDDSLANQIGLEQTIFNEDHIWSIYQCPYDKDVLTLFACGYFLPAYSSSKIYEGKTPCRSFCTEFFRQCSDYVKEIPGFSTAHNCSVYPVTDCITKDYIPEVGIYRGEIHNYTIYNEILTNREIEALAGNNRSLPEVGFLDNCLCPPALPAIYDRKGHFCVSNNHTFSNPVNRLGYGAFDDYHIKQYAIDDSIESSWFSNPALAHISLDIIFDDAVQILGLNLTTESMLPSIASNNEDFPMYISLLDVYNAWNVVAVITADVESCVKWKDANCYTFDHILKNETEGEYNIWQIDFLKHHNKSNYNESYMDVDIVRQLHSNGLRISFHGYIDQSDPTQTNYQSYHIVNNAHVVARYFSGTVNCGCYADGTDLTKSCNEITGQCQCRENTGQQLLAGRKCFPYALTVIPDYGPISGGTELEIFGGYFGSGNVSVSIETEDGFLDLFLVLSNHTYIKVVLPSGDAIFKKYLSKTLSIVIILQNGHRVSNDLTFTFMKDPIVLNISPRSCFLRGGIEQTIVGNNFLSVFKPYLEVSYLSYERVYKILRTVCTVRNNTLMTCPSPDFTVIEEQIQNRFRRSVTDSLEAEEIDREPINSNVNQFFIGFAFDGAKTYKNISEALGEDQGVISVFVNPKIDNFNPETILFKPFKQSLLFISGRQLDYGCRLEDYQITVGEDGVCEMIEVLYNQIVCQLPEEPPELSSRSQDGTHSVICSVGYIKLSLGFIEYCTSPMCEKSAVAAVVVVCIILTLIVIFVVVFLLFRKFKRINIITCLLRRCIANKPKEKKEEKFGMTLKENVSIFHELKDKHLELYEKVMKHRIDTSKMELGCVISQGNFGKVYQGQLSCSDGLMAIAVKTVKSDIQSVKDMAEFLEEAMIMAEFKHNNVLSLRGIVLREDTPYVLLPLMENSDLKAYISNPEKQFSVRSLLNFGCQVASGMSYLSGLKFVHRDLAARNCMVNQEELVKIADFGLSRDTYESDYYRIQDKSRPLPVKWMAIESMEAFIFTSKTDVWSYGVTLWEILMRGATPYENTQSIHMKKYIQDGNRLKVPGFCSNTTLHHLMVRCWNINPDSRPTFSEIEDILKGFISDAECSADSNVDGELQNDVYEYIVPVHDTPAYEYIIPGTEEDHSAKKENSASARNNNSSTLVTKEIYEQKSYVVPSIEIAAGDDYLEPVSNKYCDEENVLKVNESEEYTVPYMNQYIQIISEEESNKSSIENNDHLSGKEPSFDYLKSSVSDEDGYLTPIQSNLMEESRDSSVFQTHTHCIEDSQDEARNGSCSIDYEVPISVIHEADITLNNIENQDKDGEIVQAVSPIKGYHFKTQNAESGDMDDEDKDSYSDNTEDTCGKDKEDKDSCSDYTEDTCVKDKEDKDSYSDYTEDTSDKDKEDKESCSDYIEDTSGKDNEDKDSCRDYTEDTCGKDKEDKDSCRDYTEDTCGKDKEDKDSCSDYTEDTCGKDKDSCREYTEDLCGKDKEDKDSCSDYGSARPNSDWMVFENGFEMDTYMKSDDSSDESDLNDTLISYESSSGRSDLDCSNVLPPIPPFPKEKQVITCPEIQIGPIFMFDSESESGEMNSLERVRARENDLLKRQSQLSMAEYFDLDEALKPLDTVFVDLHMDTSTTES